MNAVDRVRGVPEVQNIFAGNQRDCIIFDICEK